jgi:pyridoxamine 5'-phosphate oxidase
VSDLRKEYSKQGIDVADMPKDPYEAFKVWFEEACSAKVIEPNAMCLSTCKDNVPTARYVLLKHHDEKGYVWYTNYTSRKSQDLLENPRAALTFWWGDLERSVRVYVLCYFLDCDVSRLVSLIHLLLPSCIL